MSQTLAEAEEVAYILRHAGVRTLAVDAGLADLGHAAARLDTRVDRLIGLPGEASPSQRLAGFKLPKDVLFVEALPRNPSGKLLKREPRRQFEKHFAS